MSVAYFLDSLQDKWAGIGIEVKLMFVYQLMIKDLLNALCVVSVILRKKAYQGKMLIIPTL